MLFERIAARRAQAGPRAIFAKPDLTGEDRGHRRVQTVPAYSDA
ncbi:hypothetical protein [Nocardia ninae]|uniref:Uncharacterized protein n=1 Tax=Nocardia ninae NBRC 108245 TaxID=1210091 RepID=A0A511MKK0_9NOCA|nr:hypothetical protein [Nocardia ninae]GEM41160.1 hypothetical protein NN4_56790 [Nocardia ninae NBRC 108245]